MTKSLIAAAAFATLAIGFMGSANAAVTGTNLGGVRAAAAHDVSQVHWRRWHHRHHHRHCVWRHGHRHCWWR